MPVDPHARLKQFLRCMRNITKDRGLSIGSTQTVMEYRISEDHDGVPKEDKYAKYTKEHDHSVNEGGVTVEMVNNASSRWKNYPEEHL
jgi:hypothetical protein